MNYEGRAIRGAPSFWHFINLYYLYQQFIHY